jgi:hypothetical protein
VDGGEPDGVGCLAKTNHSWWVVHGSGEFFGGFGCRRGR